MSEQIILLVEDSDDDAELTLMALAEANVRNPMIRVGSGEEALDYLFARGAHEGRDASDIPAVVFLDLKLPRIDGIEVLQTIRADERTRHVPVVMLTTSDEEADRLRAYDRHANSYVRKPVDYDQFVGVVRHLGLYWSVMNEPPPRRAVV